ncbi:MAG: hypothetical protein ACJ8F7_19920, partial [Gemmataceae bacterium]
YTAALTVSALSHRHCPPHREARDAWLKYLKDRQLTEVLGWAPADREYGGWGYCHGLPHKPKAGELIPPLTESNLSATAFALEALAAAKADVKPAMANALAFVKRCQNWHDDEGQRDPQFDDGGFFFIYDDSVRNKAGIAGKDKFGRTRFFSYQSATADGLNCLRICGPAAPVERLVAAERWLESGPPEGRDIMRQRPVFYYSAASTALATRHHAQSMAESLGKLQRPDGSWVNDADAFREHEPLVATSFACLALARWRQYEKD